MTPIDGLLRKAGELNDAGMKEFSPALEAMAAVQASMADMLAPFFKTLAGVREAEPFSYGFVIPAEPPEIKSDLGEAPLSHDRAEVTLGPINVYAITKEIQKALENVGRDSVDVQAIYSSYTGPVALPSIASPEPERRQDLTREVQTPPRAALPGREPAAVQMTPVMPAKPRVDHWVEQSIRRSNIVMSDLSEVRRHITEKTITAEKVKEISTEALAIGTSVAAGGRQALPETPAIPEEPPRAPFTYTPPMVPDRRTTGTAPAKPQERESRASHAEKAQVHEREVRLTGVQPGTEKSRSAAVIPGKAPQPELREALPQKFVEAPPIRLRPKIVAPAEEAEFNARMLSGARSVSAESGKPSVMAVDAGSRSEESSVRVEWPVVRTPDGREPRVPDVPQHREINRAPGDGSAHHPEVRRIDPWIAGSPVTEVIRSFGAMGDYVRAVSEIGNMTGIAGGAGMVPPGAGAGTSIVNAMAGISAVTHPVMPVAPGVEIQNVISRPYPASPEMVSPGAADAGGIPAGMVHAMSGVKAARVMVPTMGLAAGMAAAQVSQRSGASMIQHLIQSAPYVAGNAVPQVAAVYDSGRGLPFAAPVSPAAASGAENIVNLTVSPAARGSVNENNTTNRVSSFHNTFNITVNVKSGDERDLKDLGKKIGQILSEEIKRYGGI